MLMGIGMDLLMLRVRAGRDVVLVRLCLLGSRFRRLRARGSGVGGLVRQLAVEVFLRGRGHSRPGGRVGGEDRRWSWVYTFRYCSERSFCDALSVVVSQFVEL